MGSELAREMTKMALEKELDKISVNYMKVYDEFYQTLNADSAYLKDLVDSLQGISAVLEVYVRDRYIHPNYAIEKLENSRSYINSCIDYFSSKGE